MNEDVVDPIDALYPYSSVPEGTSELQCLQQDRLGLLKGEVVAQAKANAHCTEARNWDLNVAKLLRLNHDG